MSESNRDFRAIPIQSPGTVVPNSDDDAAQLALDPNWVLPRRVAWWAEHHPDRRFLEEVSGRTLTYLETLHGIRRWATVLRQLGVCPQDRIVTMLPASIDAYLVWMAAGCIGACEVPINPALRGEYLEHAVQASGARLGLVRPEFEAVLGTTRVDNLQTIPVPRGDSLADAAACGDLLWPAPEDEACIIYTSGTTGPAKGAIQTWAQMSASIGRMPRSWFSGEDATYCCHAMFHVTGRSPLPAMSDVGGRVVLRERFSVSEFWSDIRRFQCTTTTAFIPLLLGMPEEETDCDNPLRVVFAACPPGPQTVRFTERFNVHTVNSYGSTELGFPLVLRWPNPVPERGPAPRDCGWLRRGYQARIVDERGQDVPDGESGELWVKPPAPELMMKGYDGLPEKTRRAMVDGWYHTGDRMIRHPNGNFEFVDRMRDTIRRKGENISSSSLEALVVGGEGVQDCAAIGVPNDVTENDILLLVVPAAGGSVGAESIYLRLFEEVPAYMRPSFILIVDDSQVPRTPTNKIRKVALLDTFDLSQAWRPA